MFNYGTDDNIAQYLTNNQTVNLYEGGFRYNPVLYNTTGTASLSTYALTSSITSTTTITTPSYTTISGSDPNYWPTFTIGSIYAQFPGSLIMPVTHSGVSGGTSTAAVTVYWSVFNLTLGSSHPSYSYTGVGARSGIASGQSDPYKYVTSIPSNYSGSGLWQTSDSYSSSIVSEVKTNPSGGTTTTTSYLSSLTDNNSMWVVSASISGDHIIRLSATQSLYYGGFTFSSPYPGIETPISLFSLNQMDLIRLYNLTSSWGNYNQSEYRVKSVSYGTTDPTFTFPIESTSSYYCFVTLDRNINPNETVSNTIPGYISRYIVLKRSPDETNLIFAFSGSSNIINDGLVFPKYIDQAVRDNSGNVVKSLKQQNLI